MFRQLTTERPQWRALAEKYGFTFHTMYGDQYWMESAFYQFSLAQIEQGIEDPTAEIHQMCLQAVSVVVSDDAWMRRFGIPEAQWAFIRESWERGDPSLYSRLDLAYNGVDPAKLYENNADTPTSLYETGFWQWLWLEDKVDAGDLPRQADQYNCLQEKLVNRFRELAVLNPERVLHFACCKDTEEDLGTVIYLEDCAKEAGIVTKLVFIEDIGLDTEKQFIDADGQVITWMFKLYPWEFMFTEEYAQYLGQQDIRWIEPPWKAILSNKALLPLLWKLFPDHPNLLPAYYEDELDQVPPGTALVKKPFFSREGANISFTDHTGAVIGDVGNDAGYGAEGFIYQVKCPLPVFQGNHTLVGSWLVDDQPAGIALREDTVAITQDMSRFLPHIIM